MRKVSVVSFFAVIGGAHGGACTPADQCPMLSDGKYCPVNDVTEHGDINEDVAEISKYLKEDPPNYAKAKEVYTTGVHSSKGGDQMRTLQDLARKDMTVNGKYTNVYYSGFVTMYGNYAAVWHDLMVECFDNTGGCKDKPDDFKKYIINKGSIGIVTAYVTYEMGAAVWKAADGNLDDDGAAYAWDEAAAFYVGNVMPVVGDGYTGSPTSNLYSPYEFNWKRDADFPDGDNTHERAIKVLNHGLINIRKGSYVAAAVGDAQNTMYKILSIAAIRSAIKYSAKAHGKGTFSQKYMAEGFAYWRSASGYLSTVNKDTVKAIDVLLDYRKTSMSAADVCNIKMHVESLYAGLGITCATVGKWKDWADQGLSCDECTDPIGTTEENSVSADGMISGSTAYLEAEFCKASGDGDTGDASAATGMHCRSTFVTAALIAVGSWVVASGIP